MIGTKLAHYEITSHLGTGGMGEVYQATDSKLGRSVAIKVLPAAFTRDIERDPTGSAACGPGSTWSDNPRGTIR
jgi:serine/threonine protein kinase